MNKTKKKGFTLVEMLIVIVIIGILASALIPRLTSARGRANDTARKANLQQVATALISYQLDKGTFPTTAGGLSAISGSLVDGGLGSIPKDPDQSNVTTWGGSSGAAGEIGYQPITKNGTTNGGFVLISKTETEAGSNYVYCSSGSGVAITGGTDFNTLQTKICTSLNGQASATTCAISATGMCTYQKNNGDLRYIYVY